MEQPEHKHDAAAVELAAGWIALCATCGWVGEAYGSREQAAADSERHIDQAPTGDQAAGMVAMSARPFSSFDSK